MEKKLILAFLYILVFPVFLLVLVGDLFRPEGWIFGIWLLLLNYTTIFYLYRRDRPISSSFNNISAYAGPSPGSRFFIVDDIRTLCYQGHVPRMTKRTGAR